MFMPSLIRIPVSLAPDSLLEAGLTPARDPTVFRYNVPGVLDGDELVDPLTLYPITCVPRVLAAFKNMKNEHDVKGIIEVRAGLSRSSARYGLQGRGKTTGSGPRKCDTSFPVVRWAGSALINVESIRAMHALGAKCAGAADRAGFMHVWCFGAEMRFG